MSTLRRLTAPLLATLLGVLGLQAALGSPAHALGTVRYASPTGTAAQSCATPAAACSIEKAVNLAAADDEVVIAPGTYTTATSLTTSVPGLHIHGAVGQPRPTINTSADIGMVLNGALTRVEDLTINHTGALAGLDPFSSNALVQRVEVRSSSPVACQTPLSGVLRDAVCVTTAPSGLAVSSGFSAGGDVSATVRMRNVTAVATAAGGTGVRVYAGDHVTLTLDVRNVIASGAGHDISATTSGSGTGAVTVQASNYDTVVTGGPVTVTPAGTGTNQTAAPVFTDTTSYHQAASSPTVDHGTVDADLGTADLDGDARVVHGAPDIGADEYVDRVAPDTALDKTPKRRTFSHRAKFTFHATETGATFTCRLDKKPAVPCTSGFKKKVKKTGKHTFSVTATDGYGNADPTPATYTWKVRKRRP